MERTGSKNDRYRAYFELLRNDPRIRREFGSGSVKSRGRQIIRQIDGIQYNACFEKAESVMVEVAMRKEDPRWRLLKRHRAEIESQFGDRVFLGSRDSKSHDFLVVSRNGTIDDTSEELAEYRDWQVVSLLGLRRAVQRILNCP